MRLTRWPVLFAALAAGGLLLSPDDAGANVSHERVARTLAGGAANVLVVHMPRATPVAGLPTTSARLRGHAKRDDDENVTLDPTDPWTGEVIPQERIAAPAKRPLDNLDPWNGQVMTVSGTAFAQRDLQRDLLDPFTAD